MLPTLINYFPNGTGYYAIPVLFSLFILGGYLVLRLFMTPEEKSVLGTEFYVLIVLVFIYSVGVGHVFKKQDDDKKLPHNVKLEKYKAECVASGNVIQGSGDKVFCVQITTLSTFTGK